MRKLLLVITLLLPLTIVSQAYQNNAPWMKNNFLKKKKRITLNDISKSAEKYFETIDRNKKGSGFKPFKRWEYHWSHYTKSDGTMAPATDLWNAWRQKNAMNKDTKNNATDVSNWINLGPFNISNTYSYNPSGVVDSISSGQGRINVIAVDPSNSNTYYVGSPAGGIWKSTDAGVNWTPLTDYLPQIGVSGIAIHPSNSNIIYIATGDDDAGDSYAVGVYKSIDGGTTWSPTGVISAYSMNEIYIDPANTETVLVATNEGVYKSINGGTSWSVKLDGNIIDLKMKPGDSRIWYAVSKDKFYKSTDSGESFSKINIPDLDGNSNFSNRLVIDVTENDPSYVYMLSAGGDLDISYSFNGVYKSTDSGSSFSKTMETDDIFGGSTQAWYDFALTVSSDNKDIVYIGVVNIWKSTDGGDDFTILNNWWDPYQDSYTHADIHFMRFIDNKFFAGTDGGIYVSTDEGSHFTDLSKTLSISQFYRISVSVQNSNNISGGTQDNGGFAFNTNRWRNYHDGDGMDTAYDPRYPNTHYGFSQNGGQLSKTKNGGRSISFVVYMPRNEIGEWVTPLVSDSKGTIYSGYSQLYKLVKNHWSKVSNSLFGEDSIDHIEIDPNNDNNIYIAQREGLYKSTDAGATFVRLAFPYGYINSIEISNNDFNTAWIVVSDGIYKTTNINASTPVFTNITGNLPSEGKIVLRHNPGDIHNSIYLGTTLGVYFMDDRLTEWQTFDNDLPNVAVRDLEINEKDSKLYAGTYGRGVFVSDIPKTLPTTDIKLVSVDNIPDILCGYISPKITVKNQGTSAITSIVVNYSLGSDNSAFNWTGSIAPGNTTEIIIPSFSDSSKEPQVLKVEVVTENDVFANNIKFNKFTINKSNTTPTVVNSFENTSDKLIVLTSGIGHNNTNLWQRGVPNKTLLSAVGTGTNAYTTNLTGNYSDKTISYLYTNCYDLTAITTPILKFKMSFDIEQEWDYMNIEYSTDKGTSWSILGEATDPNWYNSSYTNPSDPDKGRRNLPGKQWTGEGEDANALGGTNATLHNYSYNLSEFTNEPSIFFRFKFFADDATNEEGVIIDDLVIDGVLVDTDSDGVSDYIDTCPNTPSGETVNENGCSPSQTDTDSDGIFDNIDTCPNTPTGETVNENGCSISQTDADGDGVFDNIDTCPNTPTSETVNASGCSAAQTDTDGDGIFDNIDQCNSTPSGDTTNAVGCVKLSPNNFEISSTTPKCPNVNNGKISIKNLSSYMFNFVVTRPNSYNKTFENKLANEPFVIEGLAVGTYNVISKFSADGIGEDITGFQVTIKSATPVSGAKKSVNRLGKSSVFTVSGDKKYSIYVNDAFQRSETFSDESEYEIIVDDLSVGENHIEIIPENKCRGLIEDWIIIPNSSIKFYPNPAIDLFHIGGLKSSDITVQIFTYTGQQVYNKNHKSVNGIVYFSIRDLSAGLYIVKVSGKKAGDNINFKVTKK